MGCPSEPLFIAPSPLFFLSPRAPFFVAPSPLFVAPSGSEGSLGAYAIREDITIRRPERSEEGRRPERSEGCLANARQDKKERSAGRGRELFRTASSSS